MGAIVGAAKGLAPIAGQVLDPLNITGVNSTTSPQGPSANKQVADAWTQRHAAHQQQPPPPQAFDPNSMGFLGSMLGRDHGLGGQVNLNRQTPPPPPSGWAAQPGKGPVWMEPQRTIDRSATNDTDRNWKMTPETSGSPFRGNRI